MNGEDRIRRGIFAVLAMSVLVMAVPANADALNVLNTFNTGSEGWTGVGETSCSVANAHIATYSPSGGNPGGYISGTDNEPGLGPNDPDGCPWFVVSPASYAGQLRANYGGTISFDLLHPPGAELGPSVAIVNNDGTGVATATEELPQNPTWTGYSFTLDETAPDWVYFNQAGQTGNADQGGVLSRSLGRQSSSARRRSEH